MKEKHNIPDFDLKTVSETYHFDEKVVQIERILNLDDLVDQVTDEEFNQDERLPYWAELWPSAIGLCRYLFKHKEIVQNRTTLELGCGLGLTSICLASLAPADLLVTDYEEEALHMMVQHFYLNRMEPPRYQVLDWRNVSLEETFDRIVASDILYETRFFRALIDLLDLLLKHDGYALVAEPNRPIAKNFFELARNRGYFFTQEKEVVQQDGRDIQINICYLKKSD
jgi:predicted nicotinamide N-methyase